MSAPLRGSGTKEEGHVSLRVHGDCFQKLGKSMLTYLHPTSTEQWKGQVDSPKKLSSWGTLEGKVSHIIETLSHGYQRTIKEEWQRDYAREKNERRYCI